MTGSGHPTPLSDYPLTHAMVRNIEHPVLGTEVQARSTVRYLRFRRQVRVSHLTLPPAVYGRWVPEVPVHPAHLVISRFDGAELSWRVIREVDLPLDPRILGEGVRQESSIEELERHFAEVLASPPIEISLDGVITDHLRVECDREHPVWPSHGEVNGPTHQVPFGILDGVTAYGDPLEPETAIPPRPPILESSSLHPRGCGEVGVEIDPFEVRFSTPWLTLGCSLKRPMLRHFGWDPLGGRHDRNRLLDRIGWTALSTIGGLSGPMMRTLSGDIGCHGCTGTVSVEGTRIEYRNLGISPGLSVDLVFEVTPRSVEVEIEQRSEREIAVLEAESFRLVFDATAGNTAAMALPVRETGRSGGVALPLIWTTDGSGCVRLSDHARPATQSLFQVESYRSLSCVTAGYPLADSTGSAPLIPAGTSKRRFSLEVTELLPVRTGTEQSLSCGVRRHWASTFSCFRPEYRGFSNNSVSVNCHQSQLPPIDVASMTAIPSAGPDPVALGRFTIGQALLDGGGYGYWRNLYLDSDPVLVAAAGRLHQVRPDPVWLCRIAPGLIGAIRRMLGTIDQEGLVRCRDLSGNSGSHRWSSNAMDVIGFGHLDAYVNALSYRALRNAKALLVDLSERSGEPAECAELSEKAGRAAERLREAFCPVFLNPDTGWVAGWRSRDGVLHDYGCLYLNGMASAFGLLDPDTAHRALSALEELRHANGVSSARYGLPLNLLPIDSEDHMLPRIFRAPQPTFEIYTDGSLSGFGTIYYLRALATCGLKPAARRIASELSAGFEVGAFTGGVGSGAEFRTWDGTPTGYEGTLIGCVSGVYALAIEEGYTSPLSPEWWPSGG